MIPGSPAAFGVYVHFPWCRARCPYCDFAIAVARRSEPPHDRYADAVLAELAARAPRFARRELASIYFGGGTPALWRAGAVARVIAAVRAAFPPAAAGLEITVEANPLDCVPATLCALAAAGVNRLSIGVQELDDAALAALGRDHDGAQAARAVAAARAAGFANLSIDLVCAVPGRTAADFARTLERAVALGPAHLSVYQLTIEARTSFGAAVRRGALVAKDDDACAAELELADRVLGAAGWEHYEVSSYARPGGRAVHNSLYWRGAEYLGLGCAAHSFRRGEDGRGTRWWSHRSVVRWLASAPAPAAAPIGDDPLVAGWEAQDAAAVAGDALWLGLRTTDGVPRALAAGREADLARLAALGLVAVDGARIRPTARGLLYADEIGAVLLQ